MRLKNDNREYPKVQIFHDINWRYDCPGRRPIGGKTTVYLLLGRGVAIAGQSICSPKDQFNKRIGKSIAYGRALRAILLMDGDPTEVNWWASGEIGKVKHSFLKKAYLGEKID
jgi:hypothetical protein